MYCDSFVVCIALLLIFSKCRTEEVCVHVHIHMCGDVVTQFNQFCVNYIFLFMFTHV